MKKLFIILIGLIMLSGCIQTGPGAKSVPCSDEYFEALEKLDVTICESVTGLSSTEEYCRDNCIKEVAWEKGEPELCELINIEAKNNLGSILVPVKDFCYIHLANKLDDESLCENVVNDWSKNNCPIMLGEK